MVAKKYVRWVRFIRGVIVESGHSKRSGEPNIASFWAQYSPVLKGSGLKLGKTRFGTFATAPDGDPFGSTMEAMALLLSSAAGKQITVAMLDSLIDRDALSEFEESEPADLPSEEEAEYVAARRLFDQVMELSLSARASIAPKLMIQLAKDWEYLDMQPAQKLSQLLRSELRRRGLGLDRFAQSVLKGEIPINTLRKICDCQPIDNPLEIEQIITLMNSVRSIDGKSLGLEELGFLAPHLDLGLR